MSTERPVTAKAGGRRAELQRVAQTSATDGILFHQAVADRVDLHVTDLRCPISCPSRPAHRRRARPAARTGHHRAVTRMVDRLELNGSVRREIDPSDRRRVIIHPLPERLAAIASHYQGMATAWNDLLGAHSDEELALFLDLFDRMHELSTQQLASHPTTPSEP